jgi:hypothetical protein
MAIYYADVKAFSRGKGQSSTAAAAYRAGLSIADPLTGLIHDYTKRRGVVSVDQLAPADAPSWCLDPVRFWPENENAEKRANSRLAREVVVALPAELDAAQRHALAIDLGQLLVDRYGVTVLIAVHAPDRKGDERNHHCHLLLSARQVGEQGLGARACSEFDARGGAGPHAIRAVREAVADRINEHLGRAGHGERVDHRRLEAQAADASAAGAFALAAELTRDPTAHEGKMATAMRRRGELCSVTHQNDTTRSNNRQHLRGFLSRLEQERSSARPIRVGGQSAGVASRMVGGVVRFSRAVGKGPDTQAANERAAQMEEDLREWQRYAADYLRNIEHATNEMRVLMERIIQMIQPARVRQYCHRAEFRPLARELEKATRQAIRDDSRWPRRLEREERAKHKSNDAQRLLEQFDCAYPKPSAWNTRRAWAERRRKRVEWVERKREQAHSARQATGPEAQDRYRRQAVKSQQHLVVLADAFERKFPLSTNAHGSIERTQEVSVLKPALKPIQQPSPPTTTGELTAEIEEERLRIEKSRTAGRAKGPKL